MAHCLAVIPTATDVLRATLRSEGQPRRFRRAQSLFTEGDISDRVFLITSGWVMISSTSSEGREIVLGLRGPGDIIGEMSTLDGVARSATALSLSEVEAVVVPGSAFTRALADIDGAHELIRILAARLRDADSKRLGFATLDTLGRVADRLLELADRFGRPAPDGTSIEIELPLSQEQLASWCGASRESTVKALSTLRALGCLSTGRQSVVVHDVAALRRHAGR